MKFSDRDKGEQILNLLNEFDSTLSLCLQYNFDADSISILLGLLSEMQDILDEMQERY